MSHLTNHSGKYWKSYIIYKKLSNKTIKILHAMAITSLQVLYASSMPFETELLSLFHVRSFSVNLEAFNYGQGEEGLTDNYGKNNGTKTRLIEIERAAHAAGTSASRVTSAICNDQPWKTHTRTQTRGRTWPKFGLKKTWQKVKENVCVCPACQGWQGL